MSTAILEKVLSHDRLKGINLCRAWANIYRDWGFNPLPSRSDAKRPFTRYADYWGRAFPKEEFDQFEPENIQVMCGSHWNLIALDVDGKPAMDWLARSRKDLPPTWTVSNGGEGYHMWYRLPAGYSGPIDSCVIYQGEEKHCEVARKADRSLIIAPPSHHVDRRTRYQFHSEFLSPLKKRPPAIAPDWLIEYRTPVIEKPVAQIARPLNQARYYNGQRVYSWDEVNQAIPDKVNLAAYYGLRIASCPSDCQWVPVYRDASDRNPSSSINRESGYYISRGGAGEWRCWFPALLVHLGAFTSESDAINSLGSDFIGDHA